MVWTKVIACRQLRTKRRWKVDFYRESSRRVHAGPFLWFPLRELVEERKEFVDPQTSPDQLFNYVGLENVQPVTGDLVNFGRRMGSEIHSRSKVFRTGDILYGKLRPYLNKVYLAENDVAEGICSSEFFVFIPNRQLILPALLRTLLTCNHVQDHVSTLQTGSTHPRLQIGDLLEIELPIPSYSAQHHLESFLIMANRARRELTAYVESLPSAILRAVMAVVESGAPLATLDYPEQLGQGLTAVLKTAELGAARPEGVLAEE